MSFRKPSLCLHQGQCSKCFIPFSSYSYLHEIDPVVTLVLKKETSGAEKLNCLLKAMLQRSDSNFSRLILETKFHGQGLKYNKAVKRHRVKRAGNSKLQSNSRQNFEEETAGETKEVWLKALTKCLIPYWFQLGKRLAPLPHQTTSRMHLACLKHAQVS